MKKQSVTRQLFVLCALLLLAVSVRNTPPSAHVSAALAKVPETTLEVPLATPDKAPEPAPSPGAKHSAIPILMYHVIGDESGSLKELYVGEADFAAQMLYLKDAGYSAITLAELFRHWRSGEALPKQPVAITFDDGYESIFRLARPIMKRYGFRSTQFIISGFIGRPGYMNEAMIRQMIADGHEIGSHTVTHPSLTGLSRQKQTAELTRSRADLSARFGVSADFLAYPAGRYDVQTTEIARETGYLGAVTTRYGLAEESEPLTMKRIRINRSDRVSGFIAKMKAAH